MKKNFIIAVDLGGTNLKIALMNSKYTILYKEFISTLSFKTRNELIRGIVFAVKKIIKSKHLLKSDILGLGVGLPGPVDVKRGVIHFLPNIPGWQNVNLKVILEKKLNLPVFIDNDAKLMSLAEHRIGAAKDMPNAICITLGTGVGGGIIIEGKLYRGSNNAAGEIGHVPINEKGPRCGCGSYGCLESYIGNRKIMQEARKSFKKLSSLEELSLLAEKGNKRAIGLWRRVGEHLGNALVGVVNLFNPDCIVIGGGLSAVGRILFYSVKKTVSAKAMFVQGRHVKIIKAKLGNDAGLIGAAILVRENRNTNG